MDRKHRTRMRWSKKMVFSLFFLLTFFSNFIIAALPVKAATNTDIVTYNALVGFKNECSISGGNDSFLTPDDYADLYDDSRDDGNNNGPDTGASIVIGTIGDSNDGVTHCNAVATRVAKAIAEAKNHDVEIANAANARDYIVLLLSNADGADATEKYRNQTSPFRDGGANITVTWSDFSTTYLDPAITLFRGKVADPSPGQVASRLEEALNFCFYWVEDEPFADADEYINDTTRGIYARTRDYDKYGNSDFKGVLPGYNPGDGLLDSKKDRLGSIELGFEASASVTSGFEVGSNWFPYGHDVTLLNSGLGNPIISCSEMRSIYSKYADTLVVNTDGTISIDEDAEGAQEGIGGGGGDEDDPAAGEGELPGCEGGSLDWVVCPVVNGLSKLSDTIVEQFLQPILRIQVLELPSSQSDAQSQALYGAWRGFRNIANALLILALLAIIISTAFSEE